MPKRHVFLHIGPDVVELDDEAREQLAAGGVSTPDVTRADLDRADLEIRRAHKSAGLKRRDVEGAWARVCRRTFRTRADAFISQPGFWQADDDQAALALDGLHGLKVHLVSTGGDAELPVAWSAQVKTGRIHRLEGDVSGARLAAEVVRLSLTQEKARLDSSLLKMKLRRKRLKEQLAA